MRLFIIGNGFDLAHKMKTSYEDFHAFLQKQFLCKQMEGNSEKSCVKYYEEDYPYIPQAIVGKDGGEVVEPHEAAQFLCSVISRVNGPCWQDFEKLLGEINLIEYFDDLSAVYDRDGDRNYWHEANNNEDRAHDLFVAVPIIKDFFKEWIASVEYTWPIPAFAKMIDPEQDVFLTFNYTETLERLYGCKNVIHVHGTVDSEIMVGHDGNADFSEERAPIGCWDTLERLYELLRKDVHGNIPIVHNAICGFDKTDEVYSYGFSYSDIDLPYIELLCETLVSSNAHWSFHDYKLDEYKAEYERKVRALGFHGEFGAFHVNTSRQRRLYHIE